MVIRTDPKIGLEGFKNGIPIPVELFEPAPIGPIHHVLLNIRPTLLRGVGNGLLGIAEVPGQIAKGFQEDEPIMGIVKGVWYWFSRTAYGISDVLTCIAPNPEDEVGLPFDEEYPWDALVTSME